jgi:hypothetical protein
MLMLPIPDSRFPIPDTPSSATLTSAGARAIAGRVQAITQLETLRFEAAESGLVVGGNLRRSEFIPTPRVSG